MDRKLIIAMMNTVVAAAVLMPIAAQANDGLGQGDAWHLPAAVPGTVAHYTIQTFGPGPDGWVASSEQLPFLEVTFGAEGGMLGRDGHPRTGVPVSIRHEIWEDPYREDPGGNRTTYTSQVHLDADDRSPFALGVDEPLELVAVDDETRLVGDAGRRGIERHWVSFGGRDGLSWDGLPCVVAFGAGERRIDQDQRLNAPCEAYRAASHPERRMGTNGGEIQTLPTKWDAVGVQNDTIVYEAFAAGGPVRVWLAPTSPVPLQFQFDHGDSMTAIMLAAVEQDDGPQAVEAPDGPVTIAWRPPEPWGMDETGIDHPFPASRAWLEAKEAPALQQFMEDHPDAILKSLAQRETRAYMDQNHDKVRWHFVWADLQAGIEVTVDRSLESDAASPLDILNIGPAEPEERIQVTTAKASAFVGDDVPGGVELPTAASLQQRLAAHLGTEPMPLDGWGFQIACNRHNVADACQWAVLGHAVVDSTETIASEGLEGDRRVGTSMQLRTWDDLTVFADSHKVHHQYAGTQPSAPLDSGGDEDPQPADPMTAALAPADWVPLAYAGVWATLTGLATYVLAATRGMWLGLFTRIRTARLLHHPMRRMIHEAVEQEPGVHVAALAARLETSRNNVDHHVGLLINGGLLRRQRTGRYSCLFPAKIGRDETRQRLVAKSPGAQRVLEAVKARPGIGRRETSRVTGLSPSTVSYHMGRLLEAGVLRHDGDGVRLAA